MGLNGPRVENNLGSKVVHKHGDQVDHMIPNTTNGVDHMGDITSFYSKVGLQTLVITKGVDHLEVAICLYNQIGGQILGSGGKAISME
jgi:hypothetical protein